tara:strand:- start:6936 stop:7433 length:498 start_codon:yes stop_codon:yes gene_type:complete
MEGMPVEVFHALHEQVLASAEANIMWAYVFGIISACIIGVAVACFGWATINKKSKEDRYTPLILISILGFAIGGMGVGVNVDMAFEKRENPLSYIRGKTEWNLQVVWPAEEAALRSIMKEYDERGMKSTVWNGFPINQTSSDTRSPISSTESDPKATSNTEESSD